MIRNCACECVKPSWKHERMMARSSTHLDVCGNRSETSMPDWPYFANVRFEPRITVSRNLPFWKSSLPKLSGGCCPCSFASNGLGS